LFVAFLLLTRGFSLLPSSSLCTEKKTEAAMAKDVATRLKERLRLRRRSRSRSRSRSSNRRRIDGEAEEEEEVEDEEEEEGNAVAEEICKESEEDDGDDDANKGEHGGNCCMDPSPHQDALPNGPRGSCPVQTRQMSTCGGPRDHQNPEDNRKSSTKKTEEEEEEEERLKKRKSALETDQIGSAAAAEDATGERVIYSSSDKEKDSLIPQGIATKKPSKFVHSKLQFSDLAFLFFLEADTRLRTIIRVQRRWCITA
jgi:hypothetical protein